MTKPLVLITNWVHREVVDLLAPVARVEVNPTRLPWPAEEVRLRAEDADALIAFMTDRVDAAFLARCPRLRVVACALKGYDNFDLAACTQAGVWVTIVPDLLTAPTAELAIGLAIALGRKLRAGDRWVRSGAFDGWRPHFYGQGLDGSTVGIAGFGRVGRAIARRLQGFGARLLCFDRAMASGATVNAGSAQVRVVRWTDLLAESDYLFVALPLLPETEHALGPAALAALKPGALVINVSRGSVVDEAAVAAALRAGRLAGYAADVFELEDWARPDRPRVIPPALLAEEAATVLTPHLGSAVDDVRREIALLAARNVLAVLQGERPPEAINQPPRPRPATLGDRA